MTQRARTYALVLTFLALLLAFPAIVTQARVEKAAPTAPEDLDLVDVGVVAEISKSDLIKLANGKAYRLNQIRVPPYYEENASNYLKASILNKKVGIYADKKAKEGVADRYGNVYGHIMREDGTWVQADIISRGLAWAFSTDANRLLVKPLYRYEDMARSMRLGFWENGDYDIKNSANISKFLNSYQLYEGKITSITHEGDIYTFNCDSTGRTRPPFSFIIRNDRINGFIAPGKRDFSTSVWVNLSVRVRGWVEKNDVPMMEVTHPEQLQFVTATADIAR